MSTSLVQEMLEYCLHRRHQVVPAPTPFFGSGALAPTAFSVESTTDFRSARAVVRWNLCAVFWSGMLTAVSYLDRITYNPDQCGGRPCIRGMRIRVKDVLEMLGGGAKESEILTDFPDLEPEDIRACLQYAAAQASHAVLHAA